MDKQKALEELGISEEIFDEMVSDFKTQVNETLGSIETALEAGDALQIGELAHSAKGVAGNLRIDDVAEKARVLELAAKESKPVDELRTLYEEMKQVVAQLG